MRGKLPGPRSRAFVERLSKSESPAFTARRARRSELSGASHDPIVWSEARGSNVRDADGNVYVDLTAGFGAVAAGFAHPKVIGAAGEALRRIPHALGDLYPSELKIALLERLAALAPFPEARVALAVNGADAVEIALKTAVLATGRAGVVCFEGGYHGLSYGTVSLCGFAEAFRTPFEAQLNPWVHRLPYPTRETPLDKAEAALDEAWPDEPPGAVVVEPIQARGGVRLPAPGFLRLLRDKCSKTGAVLVADEIYTGFGRTGHWFASTEAAPDILCVGKSLGGGLPISACIGRLSVMEAWGAPAGAALHTGTFYGHPPACAAALAMLEVIEEEDLVQRSRSLGERLAAALKPLTTHPALREIRGEGLLWGIELAPPEGAPENQSGASGRCLALVRALLEQGYLVLPAGSAGTVIQISPALTIREEQLMGFVSELERLLSRS